MLTCKEATRKLSESLDRPLGTAEALNLRLHLALCRGCRAFGEQLAFLRKATRQYRDDPPVPSPDQDRRP